MLTIFASTDHVQQVCDLIAQEARLDEVVFVKDIQQQAGLGQFPYIRVQEGSIFLPIRWDNAAPPYLLPKQLRLTEKSLLGLIFHYLENDQKAWEYLHDLSFYSKVENQNKLKFGIPFSSIPDLSDDFRALHNEGVVLHYGYTEPSMGRNTPEFYYKLATQHAETGEELAFTLRELATLYLDQGMYEEAEEAIGQGLENVGSEEGRQSLKLLLIKAWMEQLVVPYKVDRVELLKKSIWECLSYFEKNGRSVQVALLLLDATQMANISESFSEALGYIKRAIDIFEGEGLEELAASAMLQRGTLLGTWAQNGNPQFFKPAIESYQKALYVFTKENTPDVFADVQHKLGVLYAEMPDEHKKRGIWAGVSSASFHAALEYFTKESHPYEYASICNNFANAFVKFPPAIRTDNHVKALYYYQEALEIRTPDYPYERAISLLNYLEASWNVGNDPSSFNAARFEDMMKKAAEVKQLVEDPNMLGEADRHLENLSKLKEIIEKGNTDA